MISQLHISLIIGLIFSTFPCTASVNYLQHLCRFIRVCEWFTAEPEAPCENTFRLFSSSHCFPFCRPPPLEQLLYDSLSLIVGTKQQALSASFILSAWLFLVLSVFRPLLWELASLSEKLSVHNLKVSPLITCDICLWHPWCCLRQDWHPFLLGGMVKPGGLGRPPGGLQDCPDTCPCPRDFAFLLISLPVLCNGDSELTTQTLSARIAFLPIMLQYTSVS